MKLKVSNFEQEISSASLGNNVIHITNENIKNAFNNSSAGTIFNPSIEVTYNDPAFTSVTQVVTPTVIPNYVPKKIIPVISLDDIPDKFTTDISFNIVPSITNRGTGIISYTSSNSSVATIHSSTGLVTIIGAGTTTITVSLAASADQVYAAVPPIQKTLNVLIIPAFTFANIPDKTTSDSPFSLSGLITKEGTGEVSYTSSNQAVATIHSSTGLVTIVGAGTTTITVSLAASADQVYAAVPPIQKTLSVLIPSIQWIQRGADIDGVAFDESGHSVSLSADATTLAIGSPDNAGGGTRRGRVRVYRWIEATSTWGQLGYDIDGETNNDQSGHSISLSANGNRLAISTPYNAGGGYERGHVRVYEYDVTKTTAVTDQSNPDFGPIGWRRRGHDIDGEANYNESGYSVSLSSDGNTLAIGAIDNEGGVGGSLRGHVRVYKYDVLKDTAETDQLNPNFGPIGWRRLGADIDGEADSNYSGWSVSLSSDGNTLAIGAPYNAGGGSYGGHVRVYKYDANKTTAQMNQSLANFGPVGWNRLGADIDGEANSNYFGESVSLSDDGSIVAFGAPYNGKGHVRVYEFNPSGNIWEQRGADIDGETDYDYSGQSVSLSSDGSIVAIGAPYNDEGGLVDRGHVRVYAWNVATSTWVQRGTDIDGEADENYSGYSVSLSADGSFVAIGAPYNAEGGSYAGHVRVFKYE
jgi:hypothetical protein